MKGNNIPRNQYKYPHAPQMATTVNIANAIALVAALINKMWQKFKAKTSICIYISVY